MSLPSTARQTLVVALMVLTGCAREGRRSGAPTLRWYVFNEPSGAFSETARACSRASGGRYTIEIAPLPSDADQQREQLVRRLAARDPELDVLGMDVIWTAEFARGGWIRPWEETAAREIAAGTLPVALQTATFAGRLYAAPFTTNVQLLWYRTDLVDRPPATWAEMIASAEDLLEAGRPGRIQIQGARYEGLTVWFNTLLASAGGRILDEQGEVALEAGPTRGALAVMRGLARSPAAPVALSTTKEDEARLAFEAGDSAYMLNYTFVWPSAKANAPDLARKMGWARYPGVSGERRSRVTVGGLNLGVSAFSPHPDLAREAATCLRRDEHQLLAARKGGLLPTVEALYERPEMVEIFPFASLLLETLRDASHRPETPAYGDLSLALQRVLHPPRDLDPGRDAERLRAWAAKAIHSRGLL